MSFERNPLESVRAYLLSFIPDDEPSFRRSISKFTAYLVDDREGYPDWGTALLKIAEEIAPGPDWLKPMTEKEDKAEVSKQIANAKFKTKMKIV